MAGRHSEAVADEPALGPVDSYSSYRESFVEARRYSWALGGDGESGDALLLLRRRQQEIPHSLLHSLAVRRLPPVRRPHWRWFSSEMTLLQKHPT